MVYKHYVYICFSIFIVLAACQSENEPVNTVKPAKVYFINYSSYQVDIYKNFNPVHYDPNTLKCTVSSGETKMIEEYSSYDQVVGDTFYPHYKILLADILTPGVTSNIYIEAHRLLTNLTFVIKNGESYTDKRIPKPNKGELTFFHGYLEVQNQGTSQTQIIRGGSPLLRLDNNSIYINPNHIGFFEIEFPVYSSAITMNQLKAFGDNFYDFPEFTAERGKIYRFVIKNDNKVIWGDPAVKNLDPLSN